MNAGTLRANGSGGTARVQATFENRGTVDVQWATTFDNVGRTFDGRQGTLNVAAGQTLTVQGGTTRLGSGTTLGTGGGVLDLRGSSTSASHALQLDGTFTQRSGRTPLLFGAQEAQVTVSDGGSGTGALAIEAGASLTLQEDTVNVPLSNAGLLLVEAWSGGNSIRGALTNAGTLRIRGKGGLGAGLLTVQNGFTNVGTIELDNNGNVAQLTISSGTLTNQGTILTTANTSPSPSFNARIVASALDNQGSITVEGDHLTIEAALTNRATVGLKSGATRCLTVTGSYTQTSAGTLSLDLGGTTPCSGHDRVSVSGAASLAGALQVALQAGYTPAAGNKFAMLSPGSLSGAFTTASLPTGMTVSYTSGSVLLQR